MKANISRTSVDIWIWIQTLTQKATKIKHEEMRITPSPKPTKIKQEDLPIVGRKETAKPRRGDPAESSLVPVAIPNQMNRKQAALRAAQNPPQASGKGGRRGRASD